MADLVPAWIDGELRPVEKLDVHRRGLRHPAVSVFVIDGDAVLLQQRASGKYHTPGLWANACCTHPLWGEDPADCAIRRLEQELGITGISPRHRGEVEYRADVGGGLTEHEVVQVYLARTSRARPLSPDPDEVAATRWIGRDALRQEVRRDPQSFTPWLRIYLDDHSRTIFGEVA